MVLRIKVVRVLGTSERSLEDICGCSKDVYELWAYENGDSFRQCHHRVGRFQQTTYKCGKEGIQTRQEEAEEQPEAIPEEEAVA